MPPESFAIETPEIFSYTSFEKVANEEAIVKYRILREASFGEDLSPKMIVADNYLKASKADVRTEQTTTEIFLVKIFLETCAPVRHINQILGESSKIMRYFSDTQPYNRFVHRVLDIYRADGRIFIFFDNLPDHRSLHQIVRSELPTDKLPPARVQKGGPDQLSLENVTKWTYQLAQTVFNLANHGIAHRYIRPEYVFISPDGDIKLSHWEMACFAWHPKQHVVVDRSRCLQDEQDTQWNHLPPECYNSNYEALHLDLWSVAVLSVFCLTGEYPFSGMPLSTETVADQWQQWKQSDKGQLVRQELQQLVEVMDQVFVPVDRRINAEVFLSLLNPNKLNLKLPEAEQRLQPATGPTGSEPNKRKSTTKLSKTRKDCNKSRGSSSTISSTKNGAEKKPK